MSKIRLDIDKNKLIYLYVDKNLSMCEIGRILNCNFQTIANRLREYNIPIKTLAQSRMRYPKFDFEGDLTLKAYMMGFRIGDLNVIRESENSETIIVRCHTTQTAQIEIMRLIFEKFGYIRFSRNENDLHAIAYLNNSFDFLLRKDFSSWRWIRIASPAAIWAFIAGYADAEGNFIINQGRGRFKIDSYDGSLLKWVSLWLRAEGVHNRFRRLAIKGEASYQGYIWKSDLWRLNVNIAGSLELFIDGIIPFLRHSKRAKDAQDCLQNVLERKLHGTISQH